MGRLVGMALLGAALGLAAGIFDAEALWIPGAGLVILAALCAALLLVAARGARVERALGAARVEEGRPLRVELRARAGRLPLAGGEVRGPGGAPALRLPAGRRVATAATELVFPRRGRQELGAPELVLSDPLGLGCRRIRGSGESAVLVLPRVEPVRTVRAGGSGRDLILEEAVRAARRGAEAELDGLRPYRAGAPATRIVWAALARGAGLVERRLVPEAGAGPLIVLDPTAPADDDALDRAVRAVASLAVALARGGGCAVLLPGDRAPSPVDPALLSWPALHARLALLEPGLPAPVVGAREHRHPAVVLVLARVPARVPSLGRSVAERLVVMPTPPVPPSAGVPVLEVAGCTGYAIEAARRPGGRVDGRAASPRRAA